MFSMNISSEQYLKLININKYSKNDRNQFFVLLPKYITIISG